MGMGLDELAAAAPGQLVLALVNVPDRPPAGVRHVSAGASG